MAAAAVAGAGGRLGRWQAWGEGRFAGHMKGTGARVAGRREGRGRGDRGVRSLGWLCMDLRTIHLCSAPKLT